MTLSVTVDEDIMKEQQPKVVKINEAVDRPEVPHLRPKSSQGDGIAKKLDLLYPEDDRSPHLVRVEELLKYC